MTEPNHPTASTAEPTLVLERTLDASPELVWAAWTDPAWFAKWFNPTGLDLVIQEWDLRPGGAVRFLMPLPDGNENPQSGVFFVVDAPRELVQGETDRSFVVRTTLEPVDDGARTRMRVEVTGTPPEYLDAATVGWNQGLDHLTGLLDDDGARSIVVRRVLPAPRQRVWDALTDADGVGSWWGPDGFTTTTHEMDVRVGGHWRHTMHGPDGTDYPNVIEYTSLEEPARMTYRHGSSDVHEDGFTSTIRLDEVDDGEATCITLHMVFPTTEHRHEVARHGAVEGGEQTLARLEAHLA